MVAAEACRFLTVASLVAIGARPIAAMIDHEPDPAGSPLPALVSVARKVATIPILDGRDLPDWTVCTWRGNEALLTFPARVAWPLRHELVEIRVSTGARRKLAGFNRMWKRRNDDLRDNSHEGRSVADAAVSPDERWIWWQAGGDGNHGPLKELFQLASLDGVTVIPGATITRNARGVRIYHPLLPDLGADIGSVAWMRNSRQVLAVASDRGVLGVISVDRNRSRTIELPEALRRTSTQPFWWSVLGQLPNGRVLMYSVVSPGELSRRAPAIEFADLALPPAPWTPHLWSVPLPEYVDSCSVQLASAGDTLLWVMELQPEKPFQTPPLEADYRLKNRTELWISRADGTGMRPLGWALRWPLPDRLFRAALQSPGLSPDGRRVCFSYLDGIYVLDVPKAGAVGGKP